MVIFFTKSVARDTPKSAEAVEIITGNQKFWVEIIEVVNNVDP
jgi:hypothetical protein